MGDPVMPDWAIVIGIVLVFIIMIAGGIPSEPGSP